MCCAMPYAHDFIRTPRPRCCCDCVCADEDTPSRDDGLEVKQSGGLRSTTQLRLSSWAHVEVQVLVVDLTPLFRGQQQLAQEYSLGCMKPASGVHRFSEVGVVCSVWEGTRFDATLVRSPNFARCTARSNERQRLERDCEYEHEDASCLVAGLHACCLVMARQIRARADGREGLAASRNSGEQARGDGCACCAACSSALG